MPHRFAPLFSATTLLAAFAGSALAQCPNLTWTGEFATPATGLVQSTGTALQVFDADGPGPIPAELYVGGFFTTAGGLPAKGLARWDGTRWALVGSGLGIQQGAPTVSGLGLHDPDGPGPQPPILIVAGEFSSAGGAPASNVAAWNGVSWSALGGGLFGLNGNASILDFDPDGPGPAPSRLLIGAPTILLAPSEFAGIAAWDGAQWSRFTNASDVYALAIFDEDGPGPDPAKLFRAIDFTPGIYRLDGTTWSVVGGGLDIRSAEHRCAALRVIDQDGSGPGRPALFVGGTFRAAGATPVLNIASWDGQSWSSVADGVIGQVEDILAIEDSVGGPPAIFAAANFNNRIYRWTHGAPQWNIVGSAGAVYGLFHLFRLAAFDEDAAGPIPPSVYFTAPLLTSVNNTPSRGIARYGCTSCYPNCDGSVIPPSLNVSDFICFLNRFAAADPYANCDNSTIPPTLNVNDFTCFLNRYGAGCK